MDWAVLSPEVLAAERRGEHPLSALLAGQDHPNPALLETLDALRRRRTLLGGFMQTSAGGSPGEVPTLTPGERIGVWRVERELGCGGMGAVYQVMRDDGRFEQQAALKLLTTPDPVSRTRFDAERAHLATLEHHGISRIIDGGSTGDGRPYMVVELVEGAPIDAWVSARGLSRGGIVALLVELLGAIGHAHQHLVLHRDIKADNVLVDGAGRVRLIDFGIAALLDTDHEAAGPLTLAYAAPEMLASGRLTVAADLFAVGVLAHQLFTGELPARDPAGAAKVAASAIGDTDLIAILRQATAAEPDRRYASAAAFAADLEAFIALQPVAARHGGRAYRLSKFVRRNPAGTALAAGLLLSLGAGLAGTSWMAARAEAQAHRANVARAEAEAARSRAEYALAKAQRNFRVQEAYGDALHRAFGGEGNTERMTLILLDRVNDAYALRDEDPRRAAEITFAIGRNFVERNDYKSAAQVLAPWIEAGFGDPALRIEGKLNLGLALRYQGNPDEARPLFAEVADYYAGTPDDGAYEHLVALMQLATLSRDDDLLQSTAQKLEQAIAKGGSVEERAFYLNSTAQLSRLAGDFAAAEAATIAVHELLSANPLVEIAGREAILVNKAMYATFVSESLDTARADIETLLNQLVEEKGESSLLAYAYELSSAIALSQGDLARAIADGEAAAATASRLSGTGSAFHLGTSAALVEAYVAAGRYEQAEALLARLAPLVAATPRGRDTRVALARAWYLAATDAPAAASAWLREAQITRQLTDRTPLYQYRMRRLQRLGVEPAPG
jgi:uncharacterized membrane protein